MYITYTPTRGRATQQQPKLSVRSADYVYEARDSRNEAYRFRFERIYDVNRRAMQLTNRLNTSVPRRDENTCSYSEHDRLRMALDCVNTNVMICDKTMTIVYANNAAMRMFRESESNIRRDFPDFKAAELVGRCMDDFHKNPRSQRSLISGLSERFTSNIRFGGEVFKISVCPISSPEGEAIGASVEWVNMSAERLRIEEEKLRNEQVEQVLDILGNLRLTITHSGEITDLNLQAAQFLGYERRSLLRSPLSKILPDGITVKTIGELAVNGIFQGMRCKLLHAEGPLLTVDLFGLIKYEDGSRQNIEQLMLLAQPVDVGDEPSNNLQLSNYLADRVSDGIVIVDGEWIVLSANRSFCEIIGVHSADVIGVELDRLLPTAPVFAEEPLSSRWECEYAGTQRDGSEYTVLMSVHTLGQDDSNRENRLVTLKDLTNLKKSEQHIRRLAYKDPLTGLANRLEFEQRVKQATRMARRRGKKLAILFFDLDGFKDVNDSLGHAAGDKMLCKVAERIEGAVRETDLVARLGGDEFCVLLENIEQPHEASIAAEKCLTAISEAYTLSGRELQPMASVGITLYPDDGETYAALLQSADSAMYAAKHAGKGCYAFYSPKLTTAAQARMVIEQEMRSAVRNGDFELHYQPQIQLHSGRMVGVEALVRWKHPERGLVFPGEFISVVERIGLIEELGEWVLKEACRQAARWSRSGLRELKVAVNISGLHFQQGRIVSPVRQVLEETGLQPHLLELEVTETALQTEHEAIDTFRQLKEFGVQLAIDDFGTGYSCLNSIRQLPLDCLKVDQTFIRDLVRDVENSSIVATIVAMGRAMGLTVVAEGVEEIEQVQYLSGLGCTVAQGFFFSRPVVAAEIPLLADTLFHPSIKKGAANDLVRIDGTD